METENRISQLTNNIVRLTGQIEENYPELYHYLDENGLVYRYFTVHAPSLKELEDHLATLKQYLEHHIQTHLVKKQKM